MENNLSEKPPIWFWIIGVIALLWNITGVSQYLAQAFMGNEEKALMTTEQIQLLEATPTWSTAAFAIAVWFGLLACIALLMRKKWAKTLFLISLIAVIVQMGYSALVMKTADVYGPIALVMAGLVTLIAILLYYFSGVASKKHWLQ